MIGRIVITSVPQGIDGGSGFQSVLRTQRLNPSVAQRLAMRASYPHPHDFGDPRNPRVLFHRIEMVGDRAIHILGSVRDAGSSYTGRSNHLAELIAIDPDETRGLPGGPVFAARSFPWLGHWSGEPHEVPLPEEPAVPANDPRDQTFAARPNACAAWAAAAGDPGWAGELAKSFLDGRRAVVWTDEGVDAGALFAEAARLLPISARWRLEFNTCEIEPFPVHWRALRPDLPVAGPRPGRDDLVLCLSELKKAGQRSPDHALANLARGGSVTSRPARGNPQTFPSENLPTGPARTQSASNGTHGASSFPATPADGTTTAADEALLRERLQEIRNDRRRRSRHDGSTPTVAPPGRLIPLSMRAAFLSGGILLCSLAALGLLIMGLNPADRETSDDLLSQSRDKEPRGKKEPNRDDKADPEKAAKGAAKEVKKENSELNQEPAPQRPPEIAESPPSDQEKHDADSKRKAKASDDAIRDFNSVPELKLIPLMELWETVPPRKALCLFDAAHLNSPDCDLAVVDSETVCIRVDREDSQRLTWTVTGEQYDKYSGRKGEPVTVCRLISREGQLWLEWPNSEISPQHVLFQAIENSMLIVSSRNTTEDKEVQRKILFAEPIDLAGSEHHMLSLDPLAGKNAIPLAPRLAARIRGIKPSALKWSFLLTHPSWSNPLRLQSPDTELEVQLPSRPSRGVPIGYQNADAKAKELVDLVGHVRIEATIDLSLQEAHVTIDPKFARLDGVPLLAPLITAATLRKALSEQRNIDQLESTLKRAIKQREKNKLFQTLSFNAFLIFSPVAQKEKVTDQTTYREYKRILEGRLEETNARMHQLENGPPLPKAKHEALIKSLSSESENQTNALKKWQELDVQQKEEQQKKTADEAKAIIDALDAGRAIFEPINVEIKTFEAVATDSQGREYTVRIIKSSGPNE